MRVHPQEVDTGVNTQAHVDEPPGMVGISRFRGIVVARQGWRMVITLKLPVEICSLSGRSEIFPHGGKSGKKWRVEGKRTLALKMVVISICIRVSGFLI